MAADHDENVSPEDAKAGHGYPPVPEWTDPTDADGSVVPPEIGPDGEVSSAVPPVAAPASEHAGPGAARRRPGRGRIAAVAVSCVVFGAAVGSVVTAVVVGDGGASEDHGRAHEGHDGRRDGSRSPHGDGGDGDDFGPYGRRDSADPWNDGFDESMPGDSGRDGATGNRVVSKSTR